MKLFIGMLLYGILGLVLGLNGLVFTTWGFWIVMIIVVCIDVKSYTQGKND